MNFPSFFRIVKAEFFQSLAICHKNCVNALMQDLAIQSNLTAINSREKKKNKHIQDGF